MTARTYRPVQSIDEISDVVEKVLAKIDEPDLKNKTIECKILNDKRFESYAFHMGIPKERLKTTMGLFYPHPDGSFKITLREDDFYSLFSTYFHELGHVATNELVT